MRSIGFIIHTLVRGLLPGDETWATKSQWHIRNMKSPPYARLILKLVNVASEVPLAIGSTPFPPM